MGYKTILLILILVQVSLAQIMLNPRRSDILNPPITEPNTGYIFPTTATSTSETGWDDDAGAWINPENIYGEGVTSITDNGFNQDDKSHVLRGDSFDFGSIPEGATIVGVICRIYASSTSTASTIGLVQLLDESGARVGTNLASTPVAVTTSLAAYTFGAKDNLWENALTLEWVQNTKFGVGVGMVDGDNNADVSIDSIELNIYYTE